MADIRSMDVDFHFEVAMKKFAMGRSDLLNTVEKLALEYKFNSYTGISTISNFIDFLTKSIKEYKKSKEVF